MRIHNLYVDAQGDYANFQRQQAQLDLLQTAGQLDKVLQ